MIEKSGKLREIIKSLASYKILKDVIECERGDELEIEVKKVDWAGIGSA